MATFQRARSDEAREIRRQAILDTAAGMLTEMPAGAITLNELSRRSRLAKSGFLKYFESREAVLLELLDRAWQQWTAEVETLFVDGADLSAPAQERGAEVAAVLTRSIAGHPQLCDLLSAQAGVLEHNVSAEVAGRYKKAALASVTALAELVRGRLPELGDTAGPVCGQIVMAIGAVWTHSRPSAGMVAAYEADPELAAYRLPFAPTLEGMVANLIAGAISNRSGG
ncbi:TetR/AcrR family transcriptional regulator [Actinoplanes couchii]|uniref:TetR family transcriptional regulator n=1 Tax=Actinoplanes couchii TaxID=403638 RepID=A0ABQ3XNT4_9ACTN|nr:TetR family transcriptional regulator [Actinoplanes couchii]MDR6319598.1 AcrR family transcriptional regulator [Actinoplanes couchii]GID60179.1 TetR family transcriptional regulator [Actinoplanes couchii]